MIKFTLSTWGAMLLSSLVGVIDTAFLSAYSAKTESIAIFGAAYIIYFFVVQFFIGFAIASNRDASTKKRFNLALFFLFIIFSILLIFLIRNGFHVAAQWLFPQISSDRIISFVDPLFLTLPFLVMIFSATGMSRGFNMPHWPVYSNTSILLLNSILNYLFIEYEYSPSIECCISWATFYSECIVGIFYFLSILYKLHVMRIINFISTLDGVGKTILFSIEKVFSNGNLVVIQAYFASKISNHFFSMYTVYEKILLPFFLFGHALHESIISHQNKENKYSFIYLITILLTMVFLFTSSMFYFEIILFDSKLLIFFILLIILNTLERSYLAHLYNENLEKKATKIVVFFKLSPAIILFTFFYLNALDESFFFLVSISFFVLQNLALHFFLKKNINA